MKSISLPCLRGKMGDWFYYVTLLSYKEVANRVKLPEEIDEKYDDEKLKLGDWIQRKIQRNRINPIVEYIAKQEQQFFNSLVLGIYDGKPTWQDLNIINNNIYNVDEERHDYFTKTFGILTLSGTESIFAIDGQHRARGIRKAINEKKGNKEDEISVIFVAHSTDEQGKIRTRRLFSTLNRYAKPVSESEKIALSEDDNCSIITRRLIEEHEYLKDKVLLNKSRSIHPSQTKSFTSIMVLYDIVSSILVEKRIPGYGFVSGCKKEIYSHVRETEAKLNTDFKKVSEVLSLVINTIPELKKFFTKDSYIDRSNSKSNLLFRPIGQNILFDVLKVANIENKVQKVLNYFKKLDFNLENKTWKTIFWDSETDSIETGKARQRYATILILEKLEFEIKRTKKDKEIYENFGLSVSDI